MRKFTIARGLPACTGITHNPVKGFSKNDLLSKLDQDTIKVFESFDDAQDYARLFVSPCRHPKVSGYTTSIVTVDIKDEAKLGGKQTETVERENSFSASAEKTSHEFSIQTTPRDNVELVRAEFIDKRYPTVDFEAQPRSCLVM